MNKSDAQTLARSLMDQHGLSHVPFKFDNGKRRIGVTKFMTNRVTGTSAVFLISLSSYWTEAMSEDEVTDTILHEIAHALVGPSAGHGPVWKQAARRVGAKANRCATPSAEALSKMAETAPPAWVGTCPKGHTFTMHRAPGRVKACNKCSRGFRDENILSWKKNGKTVPMPAKYQSELRLIQSRYAMTKRVVLNDYLVI